jgi:hypothetical protein
VSKESSCYCEDPEGEPCGCWTDSAQQERLRIVAWLRTDEQNVEDGPEGEVYGILSSPKGLAERIERGEHHE